MKLKTITDKQYSIKTSSKHTKNTFKSFTKEINKNKGLYSMAIPGIVLLLTFCYFPMFGLLVAFKNFNFADGIFGSPWANPIIQNFQYLFSTNSSALKVTFNTLFLNCLFIIFGVIFQVGIAIVFNEIGGKYFKKITQTMMFLPHFISWIVVGVISYNLFSVDNGVINSVLESLGKSNVDWFSSPSLWPAIIVIFYIWKSTGYGMILYLATLSGIDPSYYEAAEMDGANKFQQIKSITIPFLTPTIITLTLLQAGKIMNADFGMFYAIVGDNATIFPTVDVIDTFVFRSLRLNGDIGMAAAAGFYQSVISFIVIILFNKLSKKLNSDSGLF